MRISWDWLFCWDADGHYKKFRVPQWASFREAEGQKKRAGRLVLWEKEEIEGAKLRESEFSARVYLLLLWQFLSVVCEIINMLGQEWDKVKFSGGFAGRIRGNEKKGEAKA